MKRNLMGPLWLAAGVWLFVVPAIAKEPADFKDKQFFDNETAWKSNDPKFNFRRTEHFRLTWGKGVGEGDVNNDYGMMTEAHVRGMMQALEQIWHVYHDAEPAGLGYHFPGLSGNSNNKDDKRYRTGFVFCNTGIWAGGASGGLDDAGYQLFSINPGYTEFDPATGATAHEYGHTAQSIAGGLNNTPYDGMWHEVGANWLDTQFLDNSSIGPMAHAHFLSLPHGRDYYHCFQIWEYFREQPKYGAKFFDTIWSQTNGNKDKGGEYILDAMVRLDPSGSPDPYNQVKDNLGHVGEHTLTWDFERGVFWREQAPLTSDPMVENYRRGMSELIRRMGSKEWFRAPFDQAPSQGGCDWVPIKLDGKTEGGYVVNVNFKPAWDATRGSDWRACFVAVNDSGEPRYSNQWNCGVNSITLSEDENKLYLVVTAVPDFIGFEGFSRPLISEEILFPQAYEIAFVDTKATAYESTSAAKPDGITGKAHSNGGGFVADTAKVDASAYVASGARVLGNAQVLDNARIEDYAVVTGDAIVKDNAVISGHALVKDKAQVYGSGKVRDWATVLGSYKVFDNGRALEHAYLCDKGQLHENATIKGSTQDFGNCDVKGYAIKDGDCSNGANLDKSVLMCWVWGTDQEYANGRPDTGGLYCGYDFEKTSPNYALDKFGTTQGYLMSEKPIYSITEDKYLNQVLVLNGKDKYVELRKDMFDFKDMTIAAWIYREGGAANQKIFAFGSGMGRQMSLTTKDSSGKVRFTISDGKNQQALVSESDFPATTWTHVAVTLKGGNGTLYIDGKPVATSPITITPDALLGPNTLDSGDYAYIGRDAKGGYFLGCLDDFRIYGFAQTDAAIASIAEQVKIRKPAISSSIPTTTMTISFEEKSKFLVKPTAISDTAVTMSAVRIKGESHPVQYFFKCTSGSGHDSGWISGSKYTDCGLRPGASYTYTVKAKRGGYELPVSAVMTVTTPDDREPPKFAKSAWESEPKGISDSAIKMVAAKADDINALVEYKFTSSDKKTSGWKSTRTWIDTGLKANQRYEYTVQVRDGRGNTGKVSKAVSAAARDNTPPARFIKGEWLTRPYAMIDNKIALRARPVHADKGVSIEENEVEYSFKCIKGGGPDSGWIDKSSWETTVLPDGEYTYQFRMRDKSPQKNMTGPSSVMSVKVSNQTGYHAYKVSELAGLDEGALATFEGNVKDAAADYYTIEAEGASINVVPKTKGSATDASLKNTNVIISGCLWKCGDEMRITWADVKQK